VADQPPVLSAHPWSGGFQSLEDEHDSRIEDIDGSVPAWLRGTLFRNGSGRNQLAGRWFPHWFDGDGMIQALRFADDGVRFANRYVRTANYVDETAAGRVLYRGFGKMRPGGVLGNALRQPGNVSNTSVLVQDGKLLSLWEGGPPFELDPDTLQTTGQNTFGGKVKAYSAHPKVDPDTGEVFNFGIDYGPSTTLSLYRLGAGGMTKFAAVTLPDPVMNHDFVLTEHYLVFFIGPILVRSLKMILGLQSLDDALHWEPGKPTRILLVPRPDRGNGGAPRWIETDAFFQFHFANAFELDGMLVADLARYPDYLTIGQALRHYHDSEWPAEGMARLTRLSIDLASGKVASRSYDTGVANEFPRIDPRRVGKPYRYAFILNNPAERRSGLQQLLTRVDLESGASTSHDFGPTGYPGEPYFIPRDPRGPEGDGIVVTMVYDSATHRSAIVGLDAADVAKRPLFVARLAHHVPYSLHGTFQPAG
jgi:all-trans-8'-apo-beta-carotenal 15,15'-oxygenase